MAKQGRIDLKGIDREIQAVAQKLKAARRGAAAEDRAGIDSLVGRLQDLQSAAADMCGRTYGVWPPTPAKPPAPSPAKPGKPKPPAPPKPGPKKGR